MALPPSAIVIRVATMADADVLSRFAARVFLETFAATAAAADMDAYLRQSYGLAIQAEEIADPCATLFLAEEPSAAGGALVGYAHLCVEDGPSSIELKRIYVDAGWQGRGLAKRLLDEVVGACRGRGTERLWLSVWHRNERAIAFYTKHGLRIAGEMSFEWGDGVELGLVMEIDRDALVEWS